MDYKRFKNKSTILLASTALAWIGCLGYVWTLSLSIGETGWTSGKLIIPIILTGWSVLSMFWWQQSRSGDQKLLEQLADVCHEWRQGVLSPRITHIGNKKDKLHQLAWDLNDVMDQVEIAQVDLRQSMNQMTEGDFTRKSYPEGVRGGYRRALVEMNVVHAMMSSITIAISELTLALAEGDFSKRVENPFKGKYKISVDNATQAMLAMHSMIGDIGQVMDHVAQGDLIRRVKAEGRGELNRLKDNINLTLDALGCLNDISWLAGALSRGDLTQNISKEYPGTFGSVISSMNTTAENLRNLVEEIKDSTASINSATKEIASGNNDLSLRTEKQASSLEHTAVSMNKLTATVQANTENAKQANILAKSATQIAGKGVTVVNEVVSTMDSINESSRKITEIISVIDGIAFQTNILALNAAVEAARAGDQGCGFAVVASEVRSLSQRAAVAAGEIKTLILDSEDKVQAGTSLVGQAGGTMQEIVEAIKNVSDIMAKISTASTEQGEGIAQVNMTILQMDDVTQQNAALVEQSAAAADSLKEQANNLSGSVAKFTVDQSLPGQITNNSGTNSKATPSIVKPDLTPSKTPPSVMTNSNQGQNDDWEEF